MVVTTYAAAEDFLGTVEAYLASNVAVHGLTVGICRRLIRHPERVETRPCLKTVADESDLTLVAMMTPPHKLIVYGHRDDLDEAAERLVRNLVREAWQIPGALGPTEVVRRVAERWADITGQRCRREGQLRAYELRRVRSAVPQRGRLRLAVAADVDLLAEWRYAFDEAIVGEADREEARRATERGIEGGHIYVWDDDGPVSMAMKTRPTGKRISVSAVYTPPELRGRGYATACVGELSRLLLESGRAYCTLFVDVSNTAAERVYQKIGYEPTCEFEEYAFVQREQVLEGTN